MLILNYERVSAQQQFSAIQDSLICTLVLKETQVRAIFTHDGEKRGANFVRDVVAGGSLFAVHRSFPVTL